MLLDFKDSTSIINLTVLIQYLEQDEDSIKEARKLKSTFKVMFCDLPRNINSCEGKEALKKELQENVSTIPRVISHLSRSSKVHIEISRTGSWSYYEILLSCDEIPYRK